MGATNGLALPIPELTDAADGPDAVSRLANAVEDYVFDRLLPGTVTHYGPHHWGSGTTFPTTVQGLRAGDTYYHSGLVSLMQYDGTVWRQRQMAEVATGAARVAISTNYSGLLYPGFRVLDTAAFLQYRWDGANWEIERWFGTNRTPGNVYPQMVLSWVNPVIANNTLTPFTGWTTQIVPVAPMTTAGDTGNPLFSYDNGGGRGIVCNAKGRVIVETGAFSDFAGAGQSFLALLYNSTAGSGAGQNNGPGGFWSGKTDRRHRATGYGGAGTLDQNISIGPLPVRPGDAFGVAILQITAAAAAVTYSAVHLTATYV